MTAYVVSDYWLEGYCEGDGATESPQNLHGRKVRGRRVIYPDELPPVVEVAPEPEPEPVTLDEARVATVAARTALEVVRIARIEAQERKERQQAIDALSAQIALAEARYEAARRAEAQIVRRLHDEDELFLLAA